ncbi:TetR/AcrR family transcriptional regulator [Pyxidicoccus xibeiensis]|uniref:TetR/AcrR family transcriptional regulator n=1 Tax=Pyxidicoccus xibeiensis TaxID=2906759 RepID=UPI0020A82F83|nr:TetR/AcrR family transcriptional regulator [Pyxidicoccus xibeiensis]MCP3141559.1 TetR/AcrR family transcriptional regulator [Pyxidicoccus xibeiensis]
MPGPSKKERTHERIVRSAARAIRRDGYEGVSVADIMKDAGLTHGGFYAHFPSREALVVEALDSAASDSMKSLEEAASRSPSGQGLKALVDAYLSDAHAASPEQGCLLAALGSETPRQSPEVRGLATQQVQRFLELLEGQLPKDDTRRREEAMGMLSAMVGALLISRVVDDPALAQSIRKAAKRFVRTRSG